MYVTSKRWILCWTGGDLGPYVVTWEEIVAWGVDDEARGGPVLFIERDSAPAMAQMPVTTNGMAETVSHFVREFAKRAPDPVDPPQEELWRGRFTARSDVHVSPQHRTIAAHTQRILFTVLGLLLVVGGIAITPLPGPWSFPIIIGGLAVLSREYDWAKDLLDWVKERYKVAKQMIARRRAKE